MGLNNGEYTIDVTLTGGSGKAAMASPARLSVHDGDMTAVIEWSSPNYDYMKVGETEYYPVNTDGNSQFIIDVSALDTEIPVTAETTAMSKPHMIEYTLYFDSSTASAASQSGPVWIAGISITAALIAAVIGMRYRNAKK